MAYSGAPHTASKRQSLVLATGPRPLQLVDGARTGLDSPGFSPRTTTSSPSSRPQSTYSPSYFPTSQAPTPNTPAFSTKSTRRQSSISYNPAPREPPFNSPTLPDARHRPTQSYEPSLARAKSDVSATRRAIATNSSEDDSDEKARGPLTLVEKHSDLLQFIAQKESKCLELRAQLTTHEAELLELKRKWERIVSRGMQREASNAGSSPKDTQPSSSGGGLGLDGLQKGMSMLLSYAAPAPAAQESPSPSLRVTNSRAHGTQDSTSSASTTATFSTDASTRLSHSSVSSVDEDFAAASSSVSRRYSRRGKTTVLMANDTGASPLISPNPDFHGPDYMNEQVTRRRSKDGEERPHNSKRVSLPPAPPAQTHTPTSPGDQSWMESVVGRRWEERLTKNQRRASNIFSDMSSSIAQALAPPPMSPPTAMPTSSNQRHLAPPKQQTMVSLLDDDDGGATALSTPAMAPSPTVSSFSSSTAKEKETPLVGFEDEDDWNW